MLFKKNVVLRDGTNVLIESLTGKENIREFQRFINTLTGEGAYLLVDKPVTFKEEKQWLKAQIQAHKKGEQIYIKALANDHLIGDCFAKPGFGRNHGNKNLGIAIKKQWRGKGLGNIMLKELILLSEEKWHPKNVFMHVVSSNKNALSLYESLGFRKIAHLPQWFEYYGKYLDEIVLILEKN
ncbi:MAG: GNAT family N-acetyltransferase [Candidatus Thermoplasmatota archaeon]|nr:GNAT family N-acetyltransferase [Candidatus Thermoplasmatota archaeon]